MFLILLGGPFGCQNIVDAFVEFQLDQCFYLPRDSQRFFYALVIFTIK